MQSSYWMALSFLGKVLLMTPPLEMLGKKLIGTTVNVNYPYLVMAISDSFSGSKKTVFGNGMQTSCSFSYKILLV